MGIEYGKFMNANLERKRNNRESPRIVICRFLDLIFENSIILKMSPLNTVIHNTGIFFKTSKTILEKKVKTYMKSTKY